MLENLKRLSHVVAFAVAFILFCEPGFQGGVFRIIKNDNFFEFLAVWLLFRKFLGR